MKIKPLIIAMGLVTIPITGCNDDSSSSSAIPEAPSPQTPSTTYSVRAVDGYLRGATVWLDSIEQNFQLDEGEPSIQSVEGGLAILDVSNTPNPEQYPVVVQAIAGTTIDEDTITEKNTDGVPLTADFVLSAPAGQITVTPLSTLVHIKMESTQGLSEAEAVSAVSTDLGIPEDDILGDYIEENKGDTAAKANALVELEVLPETPEELATLSEDDQPLTNELTQYTEDIKTLTEDTRIIKGEDGQAVVVENKDGDNDGIIDAKDAFPEDSQEWLDTDGDTIGNNADIDDDGDTYADTDDVFPLDKNEWLDTDGDKTGNNADTDDDGDSYLDTDDQFPLDNTEWEDTDGDKIGNNADKFPDNPDEWADNDQDGVGDNADEVDDDPNKSIADQVTHTSEIKIVDDWISAEPVWIERIKDQTVETFLDGKIVTTVAITEYHYDKVSQQRKLLDGAELTFQTIAITEEIDNTNQFTRQNTYHIDYNQDGVMNFYGKSYDVGSVTGNSKTFWRYIDETSAQEEYGNENGRHFDNVVFEAVIDQPPYDGIDLIQRITEVVTESSENHTLAQYNPASFTPEALPTYKENRNRTISEDGTKTIVIEKDWGADDTINATIRLVENTDGSLAITQHEPVWANPVDNVFEEYADYTFARIDNGEGLQEQNLGPYWFERTMLISADLSVTQQVGTRYLLDENTNQKDLGKNYPDGVKFHEFDSTRTQVSDTEYNELVSWHHYPLDDSFFSTDRPNITRPVDDPGQSYKVFTKEANGLWVGHEFPEWGSQAIVNLGQQIETARHNGKALDEISADDINGNLSAYNHLIFDPSFIHQANGEPRQWYWVTQMPEITGDSTGESFIIKSIQLIPGEIENMSFNLTGGNGNLIVTIPTVDTPWNWYNAYRRLYINLNGFDPQTGAWHDDQIGYLYLTEAEAKQHLGIEVTRCMTGDSEWDPVNDKPLGDPSYQDFIDAANTCNYEAIEASNIEGKNLYRQNGRGELRQWAFAADGKVKFYRNGYPDGGYSWKINSDGIIEVDFGNGDIDYFAYISDDGSRSSYKLYSEWTEDSTQLKEIWSSEFTFEQPEDFTVRSCPVDIKNATLQDFQDEIEKCGGHHVVTDEEAADIATTIFVRTRGTGDTRSYTFNSDKTLTYYRAGEERISDTRSWERTEEGYLKLFDSADSSEYMLLANLLYSDDQSSFVAYDTYVEDGQQISDVWSFVFREYDGGSIDMCQSGNSPWNDQLDQPASYNTAPDYNAAVDSCRVKTDNQTLKFTQDMLVGDSNKTSLWTIYDVKSHDEAGNPIYTEDEQIRFSPDNKGAFVDAEDGDFGFNWEIADGQLILTVTHPDYSGSSETMSIVETDGEYFSIKSFWIDTSGEWSNPAPEEGEGEILGLIIKQVSKE